MPRAPRETAEEKIYHKTWVRLTLAAMFLAVAYGFISLAIDDGNLLEWALGFLFIGWAIDNVVRVIAKLIKKSK